MINKAQDKYMILTIHTKVIDIYNFKSDLRKIQENI